MTTNATPTTDADVEKMIRVNLPGSVWTKLRVEAAQDDVSLTRSLEAILIRHAATLPEQPKRRRA